MARLTKNNKRSIKSTWREINWHVEGSAGGAAAGAGGTPSPASPTHPGPPPCPSAGSLVPISGRRMLASSRALAAGTARQHRGCCCWRMPCAMGNSGGSPGHHQCHPGHVAPQSAMGTPLLCQPGEQPAMAQLPCRAAPAQPAEHDDVPKGRRGGDMGTRGIGAGAPSHMLWACCGSCCNTQR